MGRAPCCDKANVKKGPWSPEEDAKLKSYIEQHGTGGNWIALPQKIGLKRCGKSCRLRWLNYLRPNIKHGGFSEEEDRIICSLYGSIGSRWSIIAAQLPGRTDNDIKNYWNTRLKKKLLGKQRKEQNYSSTSSSGRKSRRLILSDHHHHQIHNDIITPQGLLPNNNNLPANFNTQVMFPYNCWPAINPAAAAGQEIHGGLFSEEESLRSLLVKLEHPPPHHHQTMYYDQQQDGLVSLHPPLIANGHDHHQLEDHLVSMLVLDNQMNSPHLDDNLGGCLNNTSTTSTTTHLTSCFPRELEELMSSTVNQRMGGPDHYLAWEDQTTAAAAPMINGGGRETSWCEMSSLISLPMLNNASCQAGLPLPLQDDHQLRAIG
ncbi:hypothetical protein V2J09_023881 [Rumex salicifolius]